MQQAYPPFSLRQSFSVCVCVNMYFLLFYFFTLTCKSKTVPYSLSLKQRLADRSGGGGSSWISPAAPRRRLMKFHTLISKRRRQEVNSACASRVQKGCKKHKSPFAQPNRQTEGSFWCNVQQVGAEKHKLADKKKKYLRLYTMQREVLF